MLCCDNWWIRRSYEHICSRINQSISTDCRMFPPHRPLCTAYKTTWLKHPAISCYWLIDSATNMYVNQHLFTSSLPYSTSLASSSTNTALGVTVKLNEPYTPTCIHWCRRAPLLPRSRPDGTPRLHVCLSSGWELPLDYSTRRHIGQQSLQCRAQSQTRRRCLNTPLHMRSVYITYKNISAFMNRACDTNRTKIGTLYTVSVSLWVHTHLQYSHIIRPYLKDCTILVHD